MDEVTTLEYMGKLLNAISEERDRYKADAERLAEALRFLMNPFSQPDIDRPVARSALKAHEKGG